MKKHINIMYLKDAVSKITLIVGLPGSGKTTLSRQMAEVEGLDRDPRDDDFLANNDYRQPQPPWGLVGAIHRLGSGHRVIVNDIALTETSTRRWVEERIREGSPEAVIDWMYFENNPDRCRVNVTADCESGHRTDLAARLAEIDKKSAVYQPPWGAIILPVYSPSQSL